MKRCRILTVACLLTIGLAGSAAAQRDWDRNDNRHRQEDRWVRGRVGPQWELMTKQVVNFRDDHGRIT